jgi:hypothetical protein
MKKKGVLTQRHKDTELEKDEIGIIIALDLNPEDPLVRLGAGPA